MYCHLQGQKGEQGRPGLAGRKGAKVLSNGFVVAFEDEHKVCFGVLIIYHCVCNVFYLTYKRQVMISWNREWISWNRSCVWTGVHLCLLICSCSFWCMWLNSCERNTDGGGEGLVRSRSSLMFWTVYWSNSEYQMSCHVLFLINKPIFVLWWRGWKETLVHLELVVK